MHSRQGATSGQKNDVRIAMIAYTLYPLMLASNGQPRHWLRAATRSTSSPSPATGRERAVTAGHLRIYCPSHAKRSRPGSRRYAFEYGAFFSWTFVLVSLLHARRRYDVVYVHNMPNFLVFAGLVPKIGGAKIVLDVHDPAAELLAVIRGRDLPSWVKRLANAEERISISFSDTVITVNESMRRRLSAMSSRPVSVVMNLPDPGRFAPLEAIPRQRGASSGLCTAAASLTATVSIWL